MSIKVITPKYVEKFQCLGSECPSVCCKDWQISIDKKCYKNMLTHSELKEFAKQHIRLHKTSNSNWGTIKLDKRGCCPMYGEDKLCGVYKAAGPVFMSQTCQVYPRIQRDLNQLRYRSLTLSCPEVVRIVLFEDDAFDFQQKNVAGKLSNSSNANMLPLWLEKTHNYAINLLLNNQVSIEEALLAISILTSRADVVSQNQATPSQIDDLYHQLIDLINKGVLAEHFSNLMPCEQYQEIVLNKLQIILSDGADRDYDKMKIIHNALLKVSDGEKLNITKINQAWLKQSKILFSIHPDVMKRYVLYYLYHTHFPLSSGSKPSDAFAILVLNYFLNRCYLAAVAEVNGGLSEANIVLCFQAFQSTTAHVKNIEKTFNKMLADLGLTDSASLISLLKI